MVQWLGRLWCWSLVFSTHTCWLTTAGNLALEHQLQTSAAGTGTQGSAFYVCVGDLNSGPHNNNKPSLKPWHFHFKKTVQNKQASIPLAISGWSFYSSCHLWTSYWELISSSVSCKQGRISSLNKLTRLTSKFLMAYQRTQGASFTLGDSWFISFS